MLYKWGFIGIPAADVDKIPTDLGTEKAENYSITIPANTFAESFDL